MATAFITGITGQDGAYLSRFLLQKGYRVIGLMRRSASSDVVGERLRWLGILDRVNLVDGDMSDLSSLIRVIADVRPDEIYNLAAQSFVAASWQQPLLTGSVTGLGVVNLLEAIRIARPSARFVKVTSRFKSEIWVEKDGEQVNGKSIMGLMMLAAGQGSVLKVTAEGHDAEKALDELAALIQSRFEEDH